MLRLCLSAALLGASALAAADPLVIYSYRQDFLVQPLADAFTEATGTEVEILFASNGLLERLEGEGELTPASLLMAADIGRLLEFADSGLTQPVESAVLDERIPAQYRDPEDQWYVLTLRARVAYASRERVPEGTLTDYTDLGSPNLGYSICVRDGQHPYNIALISDIIGRFGEEAARGWLEGVKDNLGRTPTGNDRAQIRAVSAGECDISIGNTYYLGIMLSDEAQRPDAEAVYPVFLDGGSGTHMNVSGIAMTQHAPNPEAAQAFMEFMVSDEAQRIYAEINHEYPVVEGLAPSDLVASFGTFTPSTTPLVEIAENRALASDLVEEVGFNF